MKQSAKKELALLFCKLKGSFILCKMVIQKETIVSAASRLDCRLSLVLELRFLTFGPDTDNVWQLSFAGCKMRTHKGKERLSSLTGRATPLVLSDNTLALLPLS